MSLSDDDSSPTARFSDADLKRFSQWALDCWETDKFYCRALKMPEE